MQAKAIARHQRVAPRKARLVVDLVRGKSIDEARAILAFSTRAAAEIVEKVVNSAVANAENNNGMNIVKQIEIKNRDWVGSIAFLENEKRYRLSFILISK